MATVLLFSKNHRNIPKIVILLFLFVDFQCSISENVNIINLKSTLSANISFSIIGEKLYSSKKLHLILKHFKNPFCTMRSWILNKFLSSSLSQLQVSQPCKRTTKTSPEHFFNSNVNSHKRNHTMYGRQWWELRC